MIKLRKRERAREREREREREEQSILLGHLLGADNPLCYLSMSASC